MNYRDVFKAATRNELHPNGFEPMPWQCRLACGLETNPSDPPTLQNGVECASHLIEIPTGCGKTAGVVLAWLWNSVLLNAAGWPRRLIYCLPMRMLVEQTRDGVSAWVSNLLKYFTECDIQNDALAKLSWLVERSPVILMGGEENDRQRASWSLYPEEPFILIGTQDMLLSRALNRGYAMSRNRWSIDFGLLNNDCLWVCDEVQLMGPGIATASQLEAFRLSHMQDKHQGFGSFFGDRSFTWYTSATTNQEVLNTREWREHSRQGSFVFSLTAAEDSDSRSVIGRRRHALKKMQLRKDWNFGEKQPPDEVIHAVINRHFEMVAKLKTHAAPLEVPRRSVVICNTVDRACSVFNALRERQAKGELREVDVLLLHSRFRPPDRKDQSDRLKANALQKYPSGQIVVATQVIEAGMDISSAVLWTEVAPLSSLVQRFGRLNREAEFGSEAKATYGWEPIAAILSLQLPPIPEKTKDAKEKAEREARKRYLPYEKDSCDRAWEALSLLNDDASPSSLEKIRDYIAQSIERCPYSLQRHELLDFFDSDSNLSLGYTDVSPFVRGLDDDTDIYVLWRDWDGDPNNHFKGDRQRDEICAVPISRLLEFNSWRQGWLWLGSEKGWVAAARQGTLLPGATLLLPCRAGGYAPDRGWTGRSEDEPKSVYEVPLDPSDEDTLSYLSNGWRSLGDHLTDVRAELNAIFQKLPADSFVSDAETKSCLKAAIWHDIGKNHKAWQDAALSALRQAEIQPPLQQSPFAKFSLFESPSLKDADGNGLNGKELRREVYRLKHFFRPGVAHEVASALALRQHHIQEAAECRSIDKEEEYLAQLLSEYLVMSHHGRVRKVLRDEIPKNPREAKSADSVRGVCEGDPLPAIIVDGQELGCEALSIDCRRMGRDSKGYESYTRGVLRLIGHYGPFRLAYLEALLRAADARASKKIAERAS